MADTKVSALTQATPLVTDLMYLVDDPGGTPISKSVLISALDTLLSATSKTLTNKTISLTSNTVTFTSAELATGCSDETGTGALTFATAPTFTTSITVTGGGVIDADGIDLDTGNDFQINNTSVLNATTLGSAVVTSSLTTVGALDSGSITSGFGAIDVGSSAISTTGAVTTGTIAVGGRVTLGENDILLDNALSGDETWSGIAIDGTAGATLAVGDLIYLDPTDSRWELADANAAAGADGDATSTIGVCILAAAADGNATRILLQGTVRSAAFPAFTVNEPLWVSETAGDITHTQPSTSGVVIRTLGYALSATDMYFNPSSDFITAA